MLFTSVVTLRQSLFICVEWFPLLRYIHETKKKHYNIFWLKARVG